MKTRYISLPGTVPVAYEIAKHGPSASSLSESFLSFEIKVALTLLVALSGLFAWTAADSQARLAQTRTPAKIQAQLATLTLLPEARAALPASALESETLPSSRR